MIWQISIREGMKAAEQRMKELQKLIENGENLKLSVPEAEMLIGKTDFNIKPTTPQNNAYRCALSACAETSIYEINEMLESCGYEPLGSSSVD